MLASNSPRPDSTIYMVVLAMVQFCQRALKVKGPPKNVRLFFGNKGVALLAIKSLYN